MSVTIYRIFPKCESPEEDVYIGSTKRALSVRFSKHKYDYLHKTARIASYDLFDKYGASGCEIEVIECCDENERHAREQYWIENTKCLNKRRAHTGLSGQEYRKQYYETNKDDILSKYKEYYEVNRDKIQETQKQYYELNREKITQYKKEYNSNNRDEINKKAKEYYSKKRDAIRAHASERIQCGCGKEHRRGDKARHCRSDFHQQWEQSQK